MIKTYIALGSNLNDPIQQIHTAFIALNNIPDTQLVSTSSLYRSAALGVANQPDYINVVAELNTELTPERLLDELQKIELKQGRIRPSQQWGEPRPLDLDILLYGDVTMNTPTLTIPHAGMTQRNFVLYPLFEIAPDLRLPNGELLGDLVKKVPPLNCRVD